MKIEGGPLYGLEEVRTLAGAMRLNLWTRKCIQDVRNLYEGVRDAYDSDLSMAADLLLRLDTAGCYIDSEWCDNGKGAMAACDAYEVQRSDPILATGKRLTARYFVKFAIGRTGEALLLVSCHL